MYLQSKLILMTTLILGTVQYLWAGGGDLYDYINVI